MKKKITESKEFVRKLLENDFLNDLFVPIHKTGYPFIVIFFIVSLILGTISSLLGWLGFVLTIWCVYFFRDPVRTIEVLNNLACCDPSIVRGCNFWQNDGKFIATESSNIIFCS